MTIVAKPGSTSASGPKKRDPRLDFFRGAAMFVIFIAHCRGNALWDYIPPRYGLSDSADMFVFLSGMAASIAFGGSFERLGFAIGTARILHRCWQLFVAHLGLFFTCAMIVVAGTRFWGDWDYVDQLQLHRFFDDTPGTLIDLFTLRYVPHYFDILPVYIIVLAMVPLAMLLARIHPWLVAGASLTLYISAWAFHLDLPANADQQAEWYFNPFAWQLIFFTGFSLRRGWIKVPLDSKFLMTGAIGMLGMGLLISLHFVFENVPAIDTLRLWIIDHSDKTYLDPLQYFHFLALAYVLVVVLKGREEILLSPPLKPFVKCGQQALAVFLSGMVLSHVASMVFDHEGTGFAMQLLINGVCFSALFAVAYGVAWFKGTPWKSRPATPAITPINPAPEPPAEAARLSPAKLAS